MEIFSALLEGTKQIQPTAYIFVSAMVRFHFKKFQLARILILFLDRFACRGWKIPPFFKTDPSNHLHRVHHLHRCQQHITIQQVLRR